MHFGNLNLKQEPIGGYIRIKYLKYYTTNLQVVKPK